jgi:hypothetical protein
MPLQTGQILERRYRIETLLGQGGMGAVYQAIDLKFNAPVALKENLAVTPDSQRQFTREAGLLHQLRHPNLPRVTDHFSIPGQGQYLVMDHVAGEDLKCLVARQGPLAEARALDLICQVLDALDYLHSRQVIHRDVKPANVKITPQGEVFLVDFGLAKVYDPGQETTIGARGATPGYAPPEQYGQGRTDARSDVYSAGAMLYTLLTGRVPPDALDMVIRRGKLPSLSQLAPNVSPHIVAAVECAMQTVPEDRFQTASDFRAALQEPPTRVLRRKKPAPAPSPTPAPAQPADTHQRIAVLLAKARAALDRHDWQVAEARCQDALDLDSQHAGTRQLLQEVRTARQLDSHYARAQSAMQARDWEAATLSLEEVTLLDADYRDARALLQKASAERERKAPRPAPAPATPEPERPGLGQRATQALSALRERLPAPSPRALVISIVAVVVLLIIVPSILLLTGDGADTAPGIVAPWAAQEGILFTSTRDGKREIYRLHDGQTERLTETPGGAESWSPIWSSNEILFTSNRDGKREIYRLRDGQTERVTNTGGGESWGVVWTNNGLLFTSTRDGKREIYRLHDGQTERVTNTGGRGESWGAASTANGIYFTSTRDGKREIYRLHDGQTVRVTNTEGRVESWGAVQTADGLLFTSTRDGKREIYRLHDGQTVRMTNTGGSAESWAPAWIEGRIYFTSSRDGRAEIYRMHEGQAERVTNTGGGAESWTFRREE